MGSKLRNDLSGDDSHPVGAATGSESSSSRSHLMMRSSQWLLLRSKNSDGSTDPTPQDPIYKDARQRNYGAKEDPIFLPGLSRRIQIHLNKPDRDRNQTKYSTNLTKAGLAPSL